MKHQINQLGQGQPKIAIVGCVHGDEIIGQKVIDKLATLKYEKGLIAFFLGNLPAIKLNKRFIQKDLNRAFPGKANGRHEDLVAYKLKQELKDFDIVIDIHATNSNFDKAAVITNLNSKTKQLLRITPIKKVMLARERVFGEGNFLIGSVKAGLALEYGPDKTGSNYPRAVRDVKTILRNLGVLKGQQTTYPNKDLYTIFDIYKVSDKFTPSKELKDFKLVAKGQKIGTANRKQIKSDKDFYPIFLGKGRYAGTLSLMASKKILEV